MEKTDEIDDAGNGQRACDGVLQHVIVKERLTQVFEGELEKHGSDIPKAYMLNHMVCDFAEIVRWWMNNDRYSPDDISRFFFSTTPFA